MSRAWSGAGSILVRAKSVAFELPGVDAAGAFKDAQELYERIVTDAGGHDPRSARHDAWPAYREHVNRRHAIVHSGERVSKKEHGGRWRRQRR